MRIDKQPWASVEFGTNTRLDSCGVIAQTTTKIDYARNYFNDGCAVAICKG